MSAVFMKIFNMSIAASWIALVVMILRLFIKNTPKWLNCILWGIVGLRLVMPTSFVSVLSLLPSSETVSKGIYARRPHLESGINMLDNHVNTYLKWNYVEGKSVPVGSFEEFMTTLGIIWMIGVLVLFVYAIVSYVRLKSKVRTAVLLRDNVYQCGTITTPFVLGIMRPRIYLPFHMNEQDMQYVIAHEKAHLKRGDHLWKPFSFLLLILHWFNPIIWLWHIMLCRDIEFACDEKVVKDFSSEQKADYSQALLACSVNQYRIAACPLAFGEVGVKDRVKSVLDYKIPSFRIILFSIILSVLIAVCFLTNPPQSSARQISAKELYVIQEEIYLNMPVEKYGWTSIATYESDKQIGITFRDLKPLRVQYTIKKICKKSEKIKSILDKHNIRNRDILDLFSFAEGIVVND